MAVAICVPVISGCSRETVHFDDVTIEQVQAAYEHIFHPPPPPERTSSGGGGSGLFGSGLDFSSLAKTFSEIDRTLHCLGFWWTSSERRWTDGKYERSESSWWLIIPVYVESEKASVVERDSGVDFTLEIYPADEGLLAKRLTRLRKNLGLDIPAAGKRR